MDSGPWLIRMSDWAHLQTRLIWAYEGEVLPQYRNLSEHFPGQAALLLRQGSVEIQTEKGVQKASAGQWVLPRSGKRLQKFSRDARVLSVRFDLHWPGGRPLFDWDIALVFRSAEAPRLEAEANHLRQWIEHRFPNVLSSLPAMHGDLRTHLAIHRSFSSWLCVYVEVLMSQGLKPTRLGTIDARMLQVIHNLDHHPLNSPFLEKKLAKEIGLSPSQMDRLFIRQFKMTPRQYMDRRRIETAVELIQSSSLSIQQVSCEMGFNSLPYFSRWFRSRTGQGPREFKGKGSLRSRAMRNAD